VKQAKATLFTLRISQWNDDEDLTVAVNQSLAVKAHPIIEANEIDWSSQITPNRKLLEHGSYLSFQK
jgi:hypothetical protein